MKDDRRCGGVQFKTALHLGKAYVALMMVVSFIVVRPQTQTAVDSSAKESKVEFNFQECAGKFSVFVLKNGLDHSIFVRVQRVDYWKEYKKANMELGVHFVERDPPVPTPRVMHIGPWDAPPPFREVLTGASVRYAVQVPDDKATYHVRVPYMENRDVVRRMDEDFFNLIKNDEALVDASWKEVFSPTNVDRCR